MHLLSMRKVVSGLGKIIFCAVLGVYEWDLGCPMWLILYGALNAG